jgi:siroheme synthase
MFWTDQRVGSLKKLWSDGLSTSQLADKLGDGDTPIDVIDQADRAELSLEAKDRSPSALMPAAVAGNEIDSNPLRYALRHRRSVRDGNPIAVYLTIYTLDRLVRELLPFYGVDCPIAVVVDSNGSGDRILRGTLATIEYRTAAVSMERSMLVLVG